jgi:pimeloyl-ACP methyl ester carboxylesterase
MTRHRGTTAGIGALAIVAGLLVAAAPPAGASTAPAAVTWGSCPAYSDETLETLLPTEMIAPFRALLARTECGVVQVPLDYADPDGTKIAIAITRLRATDRKHTLGSIAMNPGGPGGSGYLMPQQLALQSPQVAALNDRYDLIGFDPRGVGYSTKVDCPPPGEDDEPVKIPPGPITEATAKMLYDGQVTGNKACWQSNPTFLAQLTTANVARDLNQVRQALRLAQVSYFGVSWGTLLGAVYRSMFPQTVARMWLDSVVGPHGNRLDVRSHDTLAGQEGDVARWAAWAAARNEKYGLGSTADEVLTVVKRLKAQLNADPLVFSDVPDEQLDGNFIAFLAVAPGPIWADSTAALKAMTTAKSGEPAPPEVAPIITPPADQPQGPQEPPADAPELFNHVTGTAILCNDDTGPHDFATFWSNYQSWQREFPVGGSLGWITEPCAGWPVPTKPFELRKAAGSLQMSGHRYESPTPYAWVGEMQKTIGGTVFTVDDDIHGSLPMVAECADHLAAYFTTGRPDSGECPGVPAADTETTTALTKAADKTLTSALSPVSTRRLPTGNRWTWQR